MINLFVSMAKNCKIILEMKVNQIMSYFLVFSLPMPLLPLKKKIYYSTSFFIGNRLAVVIGKQNNKYRKINTALISKKKKKKSSDKNTSRFTFLMAAQSSRISISLNIYTI